LIGIFKGGENIRTKIIWARTQKRLEENVENFLRDNPGYKKGSFGNKGNYLYQTLFIV